MLWAGVINSDGTHGVLDVPGQICAVTRVAKHNSVCAWGAAFLLRAFQTSPRVRRDGTSWGQNHGPDKVYQRRRSLCWLELARAANVDLDAR